MKRFSWKIEGPSKNKIGFFLIPLVFFQWEKHDEIVLAIGLLFWGVLFTWTETR